MIGLSAKSNMWRHFKRLGAISLAFAAFLTCLAFGQQPAGIPVRSATQTFSFDLKQTATTSQGLVTTIETIASALLNIKCASIHPGCFIIE
jgi:hypothetical protein